MNEPPYKRARTRTPSPESEEMDPESPEEVPEAPQLTEPRFYHFKILYDPSWNYAAICKRFFMEEYPYLCVLEHINQPNTHVHFQGTSRLAEPTVKARLTRLAAQHHLRKINPKARPTSMKARAPDVMGFQYMAKELKPNYVLAVNQFTEEDLKELKEKSVMHCAKLKTSVKDFIVNEKIPHSYWDGCKDGNELIQRISVALIKANRDGKIELPEYSKHHTRTSIIRGLLANKDIPAKYKGWLYCL